MKIYSFQSNEADIEKLEALKKETGLTVSYLIRKAISEYLETNKKVKP